MGETNKKYCDAGSHYVTVLWRARTKTSPSSCKNCFLREKAKNHETLPLNSISSKRSGELAKYRIAKDEYFKKHPRCEFPGCDSEYITLHHSRGRTGSYLTNKSFFKSLCLKHHRFV